MLPSGPPASALLFRSGSGAPRGSSASSRRCWRRGRWPLRRPLRRTRATTRRTSCASRATGAPWGSGCRRSGVEIDRDLDVRVDVYKESCICERYRCIAIVGIEASRWTHPQMVWFTNKMTRVTYIDGVSSYRSSPSFLPTTSCFYPPPPCQLPLEPTATSLSEAQRVAEELLQGLSDPNLKGLTPPPDGSFQMASEKELIGLCALVETR